VDIAQLALAALGSSGATALIAAWMARNKTRADASASAVEAASDAVTLLRSTFVDRIERLEAQVAVQQKEAQDNRQEIVHLNRRLGEIMQAAEWQSCEISRLQQEIDLWRGRVNELLHVLRSRELPLPEWAQQDGHIAQKGH